LELITLAQRAGAIAWNVVILVRLPASLLRISIDESWGTKLYSVVGSIILFKYGMFWFFVYPEWDIYGGIGMAVGAVALINIFALSNVSSSALR
jgi:hypothetical protein